MFRSVDFGSFLQLQLADDSVYLGEGASVLHISYEYSSRQVGVEPLIPGGLAPASLLLTSDFRNRAVVDFRVQIPPCSHVTPPSESF